jgi:hypothetical protein
MITQPDPPTTGANSSGRPRVAAYLGVKDEVELIERSIAHLRRIGVEYIMVCDVSSTDGTAEILQAMEADDLQVVTLPDSSNDDRGPESENWFAESFKIYREAPADWVMFLDADEFWLPATGDIRDCAAFAAADVVEVARMNVVLGPDGPMMPDDLSPTRYEDVKLLSQGLGNMQSRMQRTPDLAWIRGRVTPKIMARPRLMSGIGMGQHSTTNAPGELRKARAADVMIAHVALSTYSRFSRKVENITAIYDEAGIDLSAAGENWREYSTAWHWRRWAEIASRGLLTQEFANNVIDEAALDALTREGVVKSVSEILY